MRIPTRGVVVATTILVLGACSSDDTSSEAPDTTPAVLNVVVSPGTGEGFEGARSDVGEIRCELGDEAWVVAGDVTNPLDETVGYRIYTSFLDENGVTRGLLEVNADDVEPAETRQWEGALALSAPNLECILRVERTRLDS